MEKAIKKAIEGGWKVDYKTKEPNEWEMKGNWLHYISNSTGMWAVKSIWEITSDPLFWKALGKAEGWRKRICDNCGSKYSKLEGEYNDYCSTCHKIAERIRSWVYHWHHLINHLIAGKDINSFFEELLK